MQKPTCSIVFIGHEDSGKSTTAGHLIYATGGIAGKELAEIETKAQEIGKGSFKYAWILDQTNAERESQHTQDLSSWRVESGRYVYTLFDAPGKKKHLKNLITGCSQSDVACLVVSAAQGEFEASFDEKTGSIREHALIAMAMGCKQMIICVNKMDDSSVQWSQDRYDGITMALRTYLGKIGYRVSRTPFIPISGWGGDNLKERSPDAMWYDGPTVMDALDLMRLPKRNTSKPLRLPVQDSISLPSGGQLILGRVEYGMLKSGQAIIFGPSDIRAEVGTIEYHRQRVPQALAGDIVGFTVKGVSKKDFKRIKRGEVVGDAIQDPPQEVQSFDAQVMILNHPSELKAGYQPVLDCHTRHLPVRVTALKAVLDKRSGQIIAEYPSSVRPGEACVLQFEPVSPLTLEEQSKYPNLGKFIMRDAGMIIGVGTIRSVTYKSKEPLKRKHRRVNSMA